MYNVPLVQSKHKFLESRIPIEKDNAAIKRKEELCIKCGNCSKACCGEISVGSRYSLKDTADTAICVYCGQCANVCPVDSIEEVDEVPFVREAIGDKSKVVVFNTSPSVRASVGESFGFGEGALVEGQLVGALRRLGADYVLDTNFAADMTIMEESAELTERITKKNAAMPQITSCCPAWVKFAETFYPEFIPNLSTAKSPIGMQGPTVKTFFAGKKKIDPRAIVNVAVTPCTAKKFEIRREEMNASAKANASPAMRDMDYVITARELVRWLKEEGIHLKDVKASAYDDFMGGGSGGAAIFGNSGGVFESAMRNAYKTITGDNPPENLLNLTNSMRLTGTKEIDVDIAGIKIKGAIVSGLGNAGKLLEALKAGKARYDFIEVMACPGGCIGGGGQPKEFLEHRDELLKKRGAVLYKKDRAAENRTTMDNPQIKYLYGQVYKKPLSGIAHTFLHTHYTDDSAVLTKNGG
jgi:ferredoxin hydrogenase